MAIEVFNRYEHKYLLNTAEFGVIRKTVEQHMDSDPYNIGGKPYTITNIYYDTADDYLIRNSLGKPMYKEKLRLRAYGVPKITDTVYLEIKKKAFGIVNKRRTAMKLGEAYEFIKIGEMPNIGEYMNKQVVRELEDFLTRYKVEPKLYLAYDRIAYFEKNNPDLRISFDTNIRSRRSAVALEYGDFGDSLINCGQYLMEIKTSKAKPLWLTSILTELGIRRTSFSKYGTEYKHSLGISDARPSLAV